MARRIFVTGNGTDVGKTFCSAILVEALGADYWKPVQAGDLDDLDSLWVRDHISNTKSAFHRETFLLGTAASPHSAARLDGIEINLSEFECPLTDNHLIIEGAGGVLVPLNARCEMMIDLIPRVSDEVVVVIRHYLGSINHSLLTFEALERRNISVTGVIFNGDIDEGSEEIILSKTGVKCIARIGPCEQNLREFIREQAELLYRNF